MLPEKVKRRRKRRVFSEVFLVEKKERSPKTLTNLNGMHHGHEVYGLLWLGR
jgi:hypothetical protein